MRERKSCIPSGVRSPAASASCQPFLRPKGASSPRRYASKRRRGSTRPKRGASRPASSSRPFAHPFASFTSVMLGTSCRTERPNRGCSTRANREKVGTPMPLWRDGGVDGWIVLGGPARAGPGGGGGGRHARGGGAAGRGRGPRRPPPGAGGPRRGASCRRAAGRRPEAADRRRGGGGAAGVAGGGEPPDPGRVPRPARRADRGAGAPVDGGPGAAAVRLDVKEAQPARGRAGAGGRGRRARRVADGRGGGGGRARAGALGVPGRVRRAVVCVG